ncbi:hypothetical protein LTS15_004375 [Exophiala xenobiotica]|nr:hypothetical protein LTS15_004375 [Exophiala xenobiotica]
MVNLVAVGVSDECEGISAAVRCREVRNQPIKRRGRCVNDLTEVLADHVDLDDTAELAKRLLELGTCDGFWQIVNKDRLRVDGGAWNPRTMGEPLGPARRRGSMAGAITKA